MVDCTAWWAGPAATQALALLGADVVKVESVTRPDLMRYTAAKPPSEDGWWEWGPMFRAANAGKRGITLDLGTPTASRVRATGRLRRRPRRELHAPGDGPVRARVGAARR